MTGDPQTGPRRRRRVQRRTWGSSIRTRVLAIALIPSAALLVTGATVVGNLISNGLSARDYASVLAQSTGVLATTTPALEQERTISLRALGGNRQAQAGLPAQWAATDAALSTLSHTVSIEQGLNPQAVADSNVQLHALVTQMATIRQGVQAGRVTASAVDAFYTAFAGGGALFFLRSALAAPDAKSAVDEVTALDLSAVPNVHSEVVGLGAGWVTAGVVPQPDRQILAQRTGAYQNALAGLVPRLPQSGQAAYRQLTAGSAWRTATAGEADLALRGKLAVPLDSWLAAENTVSTSLNGLWLGAFQQADSAAVAAANHTLSNSVLAGSLVLVLTVAAFVAALLLANGLVRRLRRLRSKTLELAEVTLPSMVQRIGSGMAVDVGSEVTLVDYGGDEIGQVAEAFNAAQRTAVAAAAAEARTRTGINKVFLDIAHRSQLVVHRQLELLDVAEAKQSDPEHLELLFQLDHLATRTRRNAENLLILGGGQPGRKWRRPAALEDIVRSAISETEHFARVDTVRLPDAQVQGAVVGDLIHLLAELVDNATAFSPPDARVNVRGNLVGKGVVVEVEDQGLGITFTERERLNEMLTHPPDFQEMALSGQRHLGLFVVGQLARRHGITVSLLESAYGGIKAITLIPAAVVEADGAVGSDSSSAGRRAMRDQAQRASDDETETGLVPRPRGRQATDIRERPAAEPAAPAHPFPSPQDFPAPAAPQAPWDTPSGPRHQAPTASGRHEQAPGAASGRRRAALPRRERMASLAPGLRPGPETTGSATGSAGPRRVRSAEEARNSMSALQRGTRMGRGSAGQDNR
jgi:signal transduction histidine kinase